MNRIFQSVLLLLALCLPLNSGAYTYVYDGIYYSLILSNGKRCLMVTYGDTHGCYRGDIVIPNMVMQYPVVRIGQDAFKDCTELTSVTIGDSVRVIEKSAFKGCSALSSLTIGKSVKRIEGSTSYLAFDGCNNVSSLTWNAVNCNTMGGLNTASLSQIAIGNEVEVIPDFFAYSAVIKEITIPNSVKSIGQSAFYGCLGLTDLCIPESVTDIGIDAFTCCSYGLLNIMVENGNPVYDSRDNCNAIIETATNLLILGCRNTIIPNSVTALGESAFVNCEAIQSITIPRSVISIGKTNDFNGNPFWGCGGLMSIIVENENPVYDSRESCNAIIETASNTLISGCQTSSIPNTVTSIGYGAFGNLASLNSINIPNSVTSIGAESFAYDVGLTSLNIPNSVINIGSSAFHACIGLMRAEIPNSVVCNDDNFSVAFFRWCTGLTSVTIGKSIEVMGMMFNSCPNITGVTCLATTPPQQLVYHSSSSNESLYNFEPEVYEKAILYVPAESLEAYRSADFWKDFHEILPIPATPGDVDGDDAVSIGDVTDLIDMILNGNNNVANCTAADFDSDGRITIADVTAIIDKLLNSNN